MQNIPNENVICAIYKKSGPVFSVELRSNEWICGEAFLCWKCFQKQSKQSAIAELVSN